MIENLTFSMKGKRGDDLPLPKVDLNTLVIFILILPLRPIELWKGTDPWDGDKIESSLPPVCFFCPTLYRSGGGVFY